MLDSAVLYLKKGWYIFPLVPKEKVPLTKHGFKDASNDIAQVKKWWSQWPNANVGIATGELSGITVFDVDARNGGFISLEEFILPPTPMVKTGGGGRHYYFKYSKNVPAMSGFRQGIDIKSDGGYVVAPPSVHPSGDVYVWCDEDLKSANCPIWMEQGHKSGPEEIPDIIPLSKRNNILTSLAGSMRRRGASTESIEKALLEENKKCIPPLDEKEILAIARSISRYSPVQFTSSEKFIRVAVGDFILQAQRINKLAATGIRTPVSLDGPYGKIFGDVVNLSKQSSREEFINQCPAEMREQLKASFFQLEQALVDSVNYPPPESDVGNKEFNGLIETEKGYVRMGEDGAYAISSGIVVPECRIETKDGEIIKGKMFNQTIHFPRRSWDSKKEWLKNFNSADFHFFGNDLDVQSILGLLTQKYALPQKRGTNVIGRFYEVFVFPAATIDKNGIVKDPRDIFIPSGNPLEGDFNFTTTANKKGLVGLIYQNIINLNRMETIGIIIGMKFAQGFCPHIREVCHSFPVLYGYGSSGAGKSTTLNIFRRMFGQTAKPQVGGKTAFSYLKLGSSANAVGISLDEIKFVDMNEYKRDSFMQFLRWAYDGAMEARGKSDQSMQLYSLLAPIECFGEQFPQEDAVLQRVIPALFPMVDDRTKRSVEALRILDDLDLESFGEIYYSWVLRSDFKSMYASAVDRADTLLGDKPVPIRIKRNISVLIFGLIAFEELGREYGVELGGLNISEAINEILEALLRHEGRTKRALDVYVEHLSILAERGKIIRGRDFEFNDHELYFRNATCISIFKQWARETNFDGEVFSSIDYCRQARDEQRNNGYVIWVNEKRDYNGIRYKSIIMDVEKARKSLEIEGFKF